MPPSRRFLPLLLVLFAASGCSALIYEVVWLQLLQFLAGSTAVSLAVLLGTFMGGMCLGSLALPRLVPARHHPLRVYAAIELAIGILGIAVFFGMPLAARIYLAAAGYGLPEMLVRGAVCAVCLLPPTLLMGASLPAVARWVETTPRGISWLGFFYGGNIAGAVLGCLAAGFYLLRVYDMLTATLVAATLNGGVAVAAAALAPFTRHEAVAKLPRHATGAWPVYAAIALSGFAALGAEVIWTRLLSLMLGATVYTFSIILAVFLAGLGAGSGAGSWLARRVPAPRLALASCQVLVAVAVAWAAFMLARSVPYWPISLPAGSNPWPKFGLDALRSLAAVFPAACLWGASFPLALAAAARHGQDPGALVGRVYAANTAGAILGAAGFSLIAIPAWGTSHSQRILIASAAAAALAALGGTARRWLAAPAAAALAGLLIWSLPAVPWEVVAYGRQLLRLDSRARLLYMGEGLNASVAVSELDETRTFHVSGKVEASSGPQDMRVQRMLGHLPALLHRAPRSALVVGCGAGVTAGSFTVHPGMERIVVCEIEPLIPRVAARFFGRENYDVVRDARTRVVFDDARHFIFTTRERFDIITSDPVHPWVKGSATLYTREYFEMCRRHLNPGGIVAQWVPLYESTSDAVRSQLATFFEVFPNGTIWGNDTILAEGYDVVLLGRAEESPIDLDGLQQRLDRADHAAVTRSLREVGFGSAVALASAYAGRGPELREWLRYAPVNRDRNLRLQYLAGMGLNLQRAGAIYTELLRYRTYPEALLRATGERGQALRRALR